MAIGDKVAVICNPNDTWFPKKSWEQMWLKIPDIKVGACFCKLSDVTEAHHVACV